MADSLIEVTTNTLKSDTETIALHLEKLRQRSDALESVTQQLGSMWEGQAKQAFTAAVRDDLNRLRSLISAMQKFTQKTDEARNEYDKCENTVTQLVASIRV